MTDLIDIAGISEIVTLNGRDIVVHGLSARDLAKLLKRFPELLSLIQGGNIEAVDLFERVPEALEAVIAAAIGAPEEQISRLPAAVQMALLEVAMSMTMPGGLGPFVARVTRIFGAATPDQPGNGLDPAHAAALAAVLPARSPQQ
jgi:hypothetical protein